MDPDAMNDAYEPPVPDADLALGAPRPVFYVGLAAGAAALAGGLWWIARALSR